MFDSLNLIQEIGPFGFGNNQMSNNFGQPPAIHQIERDGRFMGPGGPRGMGPRGGPPRGRGFNRGRGGRR